MGMYYILFIFLLIDLMLSYFKLFFTFISFELDCFLLIFILICFFKYLVMNDLINSFNQFQIIIR